MNEGSVWIPANSYQFLMNSGRPSSEPGVPRSDEQQKERVMASSGTTTSRPAQAGITEALADDFAALMCALHDLIDPYRREAHYMRGPGPKWHARHAGNDVSIVPPAAPPAATKEPA
jgi:hypothetical protein